MMHSFKRVCVCIERMLFCRTDNVEKLMPSVCLSVCMFMCRCVNVNTVKLRIEAGPRIDAGPRIQAGGLIHLYR